MIVLNFVQDLLEKIPNAREHDFELMLGPIWNDEDDVGAFF